MLVNSRLLHVDIWHRDSYAKNLHREEIKEKGFCNLCMRG
jgi:hypothetical protein